MNIFEEIKALNNLTEWGGLRHTITPDIVDEIRFTSNPLTSLKAKTFWRHYESIRRPLIRLN